jgi:hypothetical protein
MRSNTHTPSLLIKYVGPGFRKQADVKETQFLRKPEGIIRLKTSLNPGQNKRR